MKVILPKQLVSLEDFPEYDELPLFFLAGPILGGGDWQSTMCQLLQQHEDNILVATPSTRYGDGHPLEAHHVPVDGSEFERQLSWERKYLDVASTLGSIIFWLPCESKTDPRNDGQPYARDTYGELGEWRGRLMANPKLHVVVGAEFGFPGLSQIKRNFREALGYEFPIYESMKATADAAFRMTVW